jgi:hypothetical protein
MLVTTTASSMSNATVPRPSQNVRYDEANGTTAETQPTGAKGSSSVVSTCAATNATASSERLRCSLAVITLGQRGVASRAVPATPSTTAAVSRTSDITPVARVAYHSGLGPAVMILRTWSAAALTWSRAAVRAAAGGTQGRWSAGLRLAGMRLAAWWSAGWWSLGPGRLGPGRLRGCWPGAARLRPGGGRPVIGQGVSERGAKAERRGRGTARDPQRQPAGPGQPVVTPACRVVKMPGPEDGRRCDGVLAQGGRPPVNPRRGASSAISQTFRTR